MTKQEKDQILDWIRSEHAAGRALNLHAVKRRRPDLVARVYEVRPFWGWWQAIQDAGLDYTDLKVELAQNVACRICGYEGKQLNAHLRFKHKVTSAEYREKFPGAEISGEARRANMKKDGGNHLLPHWEPLYSDEYMMDRTFRYHQMGHHLRTTWILDNDHNLWQHVHRQGVTWDSYVASLGIAYSERARKRRKPRSPGITKEALIEALHATAERKRWTPQGTQYGVLSAKLVKGIQILFGSYAAALEAAGIPLPSHPDPRLPKFSPDEILDRLRHLAVSGVSITAAGVKESTESFDLHHYVQEMGGYPAVREQLGIAKQLASEKAEDLSREEVIAAMRRRAEEGKSCRRTALHTGPEADTRLLRAALRHFPKLTDLLDEAGIEYENVSTIRARQRKEALLQSLRHRHETGGVIDRYSIRKEEGGKKFLRDCSLTFGNWEKTLEAAGLPKEMDDSRTLYLERLAGKIREVYLQGRALDPYGAKADPATAQIYREAKFAFRSWRSAVIAAGLEWPQPRFPRPNPEIRLKNTAAKTASEISELARGSAARKRAAPRAERETGPDPRKVAVIEAIQERHREKKPIAGRDIRRDPEAVALYDEARRLFTSWKAALREAGCTPEPPPPINLPRSLIAEELELAYPIDPRWLLPLSELGEEQDEDDFDGGEPRKGSTAQTTPTGEPPPPKKIKKQRHTPSRAELRKKRKKGRR